MRIFFESWKYLFRNLWYVLPFSVVPAVFLALSFDYTAASDLMRAFMAGDPRVEFLHMLRALSLIRFDSVLSVVYSLLAFVCTVVFASFILAAVEKHMRIGKRNFNGVWAQFRRMLLPTFCIALLMLVLFEVWAIAVSAVCFALSALDVTALVYLGEFVVLCAFSAVLLHLVTVFFLWLPCIQITSFRPFDALIYSYRMVTNVRGRLFGSLALSFFGAVIVTALCVLLPSFVCLIVVFVLYLFLFPAFCVRMETVYFECDRLDREDRLRSYREF